LEPVERSLSLRLFQNQEQAFASHRKGVRWLLERRLARDLKYLRRNLALPKDAAIGARYFGGADALEEKMVQRLLVQFFEKDFRSGAELEKYAAKVGAAIMDKGLALKDQVRAILESLSGASSCIGNHGKVNKCGKGARIQNPPGLGRSSSPGLSGAL
jgi:ATP-dependent helicase HrpA